MDNDNYVKGSGIGVGTLVWIALIILKATETIGMNWFWVISSIIWIPLGMILFIMAIFGIILLVVFIIEELS